MKHSIALLGSTGSIGKQTLDVLRQFPEYFQVEMLSAENSADLLIEQAKEFNPNAVVIGEKKYQYVKEALANTDIKVFSGAKALEEAVCFESVDTVVVAVMGSVGLEATIAAIRAGKKIALANKETLVMGGDIVNQELDKHDTYMYPIDSEHSAIFQCLIGEDINAVEKLILTGSGGPFRGKNLEYLENVGVQEALAHPTWSMGKKISIDSATLMNKGLELIEACHLFRLPKSKIEVVIHPQSIIHSMVAFKDASIKAQMSLPNMQGPILYALSCPYRLEVEPKNIKRLNFAELKNMSFEEADRQNFPCLKLAEDAIEIGGTMPCIMNAANEVAVDAFLNEKIKFTAISRVIEKTMLEMDVQKYVLKNTDLQSLRQIDIRAREVAQGFVKENAK